MKRVRNYKHIGISFSCLWMRWFHTRMKQKVSLSADIWKYKCVPIPHTSPWAGISLLCQDAAGHKCAVARSELPRQLQGQSTHRAGDEDRGRCLETHSEIEANLFSFFGMKGAEGVRWFQERVGLWTVDRFSSPLFLKSWVTN